MFHELKREGPATHRSLERGLRVIEVTAASGGSATLADIARRAALPRSTAHHIARALVELGYLAQEREASPYRLGPRLFRLMDRHWTPAQLADAARHSLDELSRRTGHGASLAVLKGGVVTIVAKRESSGPVRVVQEIGAARPLHCTAVGKILAAWLPAPELEALLATIDYRRFTARTIVSQAGLVAELARVRARGVALDNEEHLDGIRCAAAPVRDHTGDVCAALCVIGPSHQLQRRALEPVRVAVLEVASALSRRLGGESAAARSNRTRAR
jgi:DNA-binding IclR family transcriptional regulator